ncbi:MAG TPA: hypothetical protein VIU63_11030 [Nitrospira sp.]
MSASLRHSPFRPFFSFFRIITLLLLIAWLLPMKTSHASAFSSAPTTMPDWMAILRDHANRLSAIDSDQSAKELFVSTLGPALHLADAAGTIGAKGLPAKLTAELLVAEITGSAQRLVAALAAWQLADSITRSLAVRTPQPSSSVRIISPRLDWLNANGPFPFLSAVISAQTAEAQSNDTDEDRAITMAIAAGRAAVEASQQVMSEWWRLNSWKDRVRTLRGQTRLCGTWQWVIHNHQQHHQEQKLSVLFPPPGSEGNPVPGLVETIVLGDTVYLRWEHNGKIQEDSLLFTKEAQRLEGTFVNSQGGWGSISGKRTLSCAQKESKPH